MDENKEKLNGENSASEGWQTASAAEAEAASSPEDEQKVTKKTLGRELLEWGEAIVLAVLIALVVRSFIFTVVRVDGHSMDSTLSHNDRLVVWRLGYEPKQGDIIIFAPPIPENEERSSFNQVYWVKRVIATGGQHVDIDYSTNSVYVDGEKLEEDYLNEIMTNPGSGTITSIDVPEGKVFLMGDNRNYSRDCRYIGAVDEDTIVGKAVLRFWPLSSFGAVTHAN